MNKKAFKEVPGETKKRDITREKILSAARRVFATLPYREASMRMIGKTGDFEHPLVHYYFPTKADLFAAVVEDLCEEFYQANLSWFAGLERLPPREGLSLFIDRFLDYNFEHPEPLRIIALNFAQIDRLDQIPGYQHIPEMLAKTQATFEANALLKTSPASIRMFLSAFHTIIITYLGAASCQAQIMDMDHQSGLYRAWVKDSLLFVFLPLLEKMIFAERKKDKGTKD